MADDYSNIGFRIGDEADFSTLHTAHPKLITRLKNVYGETVERFSPDGRAELWYYENGDGICGDYAEPGYHSGRSMEVIPQNWLPGAVLEVETAICPLTVAVPSAFLAPLELNKPCNMELTLFARNLEVYENADTFMEKHKGSTAPESIIPYGSFSLPEKEEEFAPDAVAEVSGVIMEAALQENPVHHGQYYEIGLSCLGMNFTVVANADLLPEPPQVGNILHGFYWVSGRITDN